MREHSVTLVWSAQAVADLADIAAYIREHSPRSARRIREEIRQSTRHLSRFPLSGRMVPELELPAYREVTVRGYRIIYEVTEEQVEILTVFHGSREFSALPRPSEADAE